MPGPYLIEFYDQDNINKNFVVGWRHAQLTESADREIYWLSRRTGSDAQVPIWINFAGARRRLAIGELKMMKYQNDQLGEQTNKTKAFLIEESLFYFPVQTRASGKYSNATKKEFGKEIHNYIRLKRFLA